LSERGGLFLNDKLSNRSIEGRGFGLTSIKPIRKGELLMKIPLSATMNNHSCVTSDLGKVLTPHFRSEVTRALGDDSYPDYESVALSVCLLYQQSRGAESAYFPYLRMLPKGLDQPLLWSNDELQHLAGTGIPELHLRRLVGTLSRLYKVAGPLFEHNPKLFPAPISAAESSPYSFEAFARAVTLVSSRSFGHSPPFSSMLVPVVDLLNHATDLPPVHHSALSAEDSSEVHADGSTVAVSASEPPSVADADSEIPVFKLYAAADFNIGDEVVHSYELSHTSTYFLLIYGFLHTGIAVELPVLVADLPKERPGGDIGAMENGGKLVHAIKDALGEEVFKAVATAEAFFLSGAGQGDSQGGASRDLGREETSGNSESEHAEQRVREARADKRAQADDQVRRLMCLLRLRAMDEQQMGQMSACMAGAADGASGVSCCFEAKGGHHQVELSATKELALLLKKTLTRLQVEPPVHPATAMIEPGARRRTMARGLKAAQIAFIKRQR
jgi:hypothetical protein